MNTTPSHTVVPAHHVVLGAGGHMREAHLQFLESARISHFHIYDPGAEPTALQDDLPAGHTMHSSEHDALSQVAEAVWIGSPDEYHLNQLAASIAARKHVFVEKPLATRIDELPILRALLRQAQQDGLIVLSCHPRRFDPPFVAMKERLPELHERFGTLLSCSFDFTYHAPVAEWKHSRSLLLDHANHEIDLINFLFGYSLPTATRHHDSPTYYSLSGKREDGLVFSFSGTRALTGYVYDELLRVRFERGEVSLFATKGLLQTYDHEARTIRDEQVPPTHYATRNRAVTDNFIRVIDGAATPYLTHEEMLCNTEFAVTLIEQGQG